MICAGCASVGNLEGGKKDTQPPKLVSISPKDSLLNTRVNRIELHFDEYIALNDASREVQISPLLSVAPTVTGNNKKVVVKIADSLLQENTTYRISFGASVKDIHEDNKISGLTYTFSTGNYFDSLEINGKVLNARTGLPDTSARILLYSSSTDDSAVIRSRPLYIGRVNTDGSFSVKGLPGKKFRIYALKDDNDNLIYDGGKEKIGFLETLIMPGDSLSKKIVLRTFEEIVDTTLINSDSIAKDLGKRGMNRNNRVEDFTYSVAVDTSDIGKRTKEITKPLEITFTKPVTEFNKSRITLSVDSIKEQTFTAYVDTQRRNVVVLNGDWKEDIIYTLRLLKGFAKDSSGTEALPSKYLFHTKRDDDYSKLVVNVPSRYSSKKHILLIKTGQDTVYNQLITDTAISLKRLMPGNYNMRIIVDENENGIWDTGDLLLKKQPEYVIPFKSDVTLKAGWDNTFDFEEKKPDVGKSTKDASPLKRDKGTPK
jgi:methionine-rich copper-binding protein CopC